MEYVISGLRQRPGRGRKVLKAVQQSRLCAVSSNYAGSSETPGEQIIPQRLFDRAVTGDGKERRLVGTRRKLNV